MKRLSLQWRITLLTIFLLAAACVTMKTLLCSSGHAYMDSIGNYVMHYAEEDPQAIRVDIPEEQWKDMSERFSGEFVVELTGAKHSFCMRGWYIALAVTVLGGAVAYFVSGSALKPLKRFTAKAERVQLQSLSEITLSEDEAVEFSRLSRAFNQMLLRLKQAFDAQQQFVGNAAHELRTPLALMQARLDLYMSTDHGDSCPETAETIAMMREQTERLSRMVRTLLDMSDLKTVPRTDRIQLAPMIEEVLADLSPLAESWELSCHEAGPSVIAGGAYAGRTLGEYLAEHPQDAGTKAQNAGAFPLLIKLIDAAGPLSVQVHPDDAYAREFEHSLGKSEMWLVLDASEGAGIYYGFKRETSLAEMRAAIENNTLTELLNWVPAKTGDCFFIPAGTVHAIGAGLMVAEVQQSSNLTYRVYDYGRVGADGRPRELHIDKALAVARREPPKDPVGPTEPERAVAGGRIQPLFSCDKFTTETRTVEGEMADSVSPESFVSLLVLAGEGAIKHGGETYPVKKGQSVFLPAGLGDYALTGRMKLLRTRV